jgi:hypothetical protein
MYDMNNLKKFPRLAELAPEAFKAFVAFDEAVVKHGVIPLKYKELIAIAVANYVPLRIEIHTKKARVPRNDQNWPKPHYSRPSRVGDDRDAYAGINEAVSDCRVLLLGPASLAVSEIAPHLTTFRRPCRSYPSHHSDPAGFVADENVRGLAPWPNEMEATRRAGQSALAG